MKQLDAYTAVGLAEGFVEGTSTEQLEAWAYIARTGMYRSLQGFFGRTIQSMVDNGTMDWDGNIDWDRVDELTDMAY
jgi:hypothetical protein